MQEDSEDEEIADVSQEGDQKGAKGYKAIPKEMCQTIRVMNAKTNRYKRTFKCLVDGCGRTFAKSCNMAVHLRKHTGDKPHACPHCPKVFSQSDILSHHLKNVHKTEKKVTIRVTNSCPEDSSQDLNLTRHTDMGNYCPANDSGDATTGVY